MSGEKDRRSSFKPFQFITGKIRNKLFAILLLIALGTILVAAVAIVSMEFAQRTVDDIVDRKGRIVSLADKAEVEILQAREKDQQYLLNYKKLGFENARGEYVQKVDDHITQTSVAVSEILKLEPGNQAIVDQIENVQERLKDYSKTFNKVVDHVELSGYKDFGAVGKLRKAAHGIEEIIKRSGLDELQIEYLSLRRMEKDYLLRGERKYIFDAYQQAEKLKSIIVLSSMYEESRKKGALLADEYMIAFNEAVKADSEVARYSRGFVSAVNGIFPSLETIVESVQLEQETAIAAMKKQNEVALIVVLATTIGTLILGLLAAFFFSGRLTKQIDNIMEMFGSIGIGDFTARAEIVTGDELGEMAESLNAMLDNTLSLIQSRDERDAIQDSIMNLLMEISELADGDLTVRAEVTEEITGAIADSFNTMAEQLSTVVRDVKDASALVGQSSYDVDNVTKKLSEYSEDQAAKVAEAIEKITDMANKNKQVSESASQSAEVSNLAKQSAQEGSEAVKRTNEAMASIKDNMRGTSSAIKRLGESSQEIGDIIQIINDIADRTSILALNASIQAAMAGDAGRGFAVVAEEVQRLAERSAESTKQIESLIHAIQGDISAAGSSMETSIQYVVDGTGLADEAHAKLGEIENVSTQLAEIIEGITSSAKEQAEESERITEMMQEVGELTEQTTSATRETTASMEQITSTSKQLEGSISAFKIDE